MTSEEIFKTTAAVRTCVDCVMGWSILVSGMKEQEIKANVEIGAEARGNLINKFDG